MSDELAVQILGYDRLGAMICGWKKGGV